MLHNGIPLGDRQGCCSPWETASSCLEGKVFLGRGWEATTEVEGSGKGTDSREAAHAGVVVSRVCVGHPWGARATLRGRRLASGPLCQLQPAQASLSVTRRQQ